MTDYDSMSVHELVLEAAKDGMQGFLHDANPELCELPEIESALRKAVIREDVVHCGECVYAAWESQEPYGKGEGIACHVIAGRSRPWLGAVTDYCSEGKKAKS